jgi:hypothetical protein
MTPVSLDDAQWELYHVDRDFNERFDLASENPRKLDAMKRLFDEEAKRNGVYPLIAASMRSLFTRQLEQLREMDAVSSTTRERSESPAHSRRQSTYFLSLPKSISRSTRAEHSLRWAASTRGTHSI